MLKTLRLKPFDKRGFPFDLPVFQNSREMEIDKPKKEFIYWMSPRHRFLHSANSL